MSKYVYYLNVFGEDFPKRKKFYVDYEDAYSRALSYMQDHLPEIARNLPPKALFELFDKSFHITTIDTEICKKYRKMFIEGEQKIKNKINKNAQYKKYVADDFADKDDERIEPQGILGDISQTA